ncbi:YdeI/OmpD-associated family protein [Ascidiimonas sp. W6]|uniref:YdeI/OmpD-associated family protein n=1 Tax=Ascidiimonas meishanensis TaxID=3128903 RepID=UPI0030EE91F0
MNAVNSVESFFKNDMFFKKELQILREILLNCDLEETLKWNGPVYTYQKKNIVGIGCFKSYVGLWFFQGVLLSDPYKVLVNAQADKTIAMRQLRFTPNSTINKLLITEYVLEAIQNCKDGKHLKPQRKKPFQIPERLKNILKADEKTEKAFHQLSLTQKREFAAYLSTAKKEVTLKKRIEKIIPLIQKGIGLNDKYR